MRETILAVTFGSQSIKTSNVALFCLSFYVFPSGLHATNLGTKLRTIQQNLGKIKNSQPEPQFYWFL